MAITFIQTRKKQKYLLIIAIVVILFAGVVLWWSSFRKEKLVPPPPVGVITYQEIKIDFDVLENFFLKESQSFIEFPPFEGVKGRENPYLPYSLEKKTGR